MSIQGTYPEASEHGNFKLAADSIAVPHPYCITPRHVAWASDHHSGILSEEAIRSAEKAKKACCGICKGELSYSEHGSALVVECYAAMKDAEGKAVPELHAYLLAMKDEATRNKYAGFAFVDRRVVRAEA
jgi:hypothetical protein